MPSDTAKHTPGVVSQLPWHDGDGYSWGGDIIVSFGDRAINLGNSTHSGETLHLARLIAAAPDLLVAVQRCLNFIEGTEAELGEKFECGNLARSAIAKAEGLS